MTVPVYPQVRSAFLDQARKIDRKGFVQDVTYILRRVIDKSRDVVGDNNFTDPRQIRGQFVLNKSSRHNRSQEKCCLVRFRKMSRVWPLNHNDNIHDCREPSRWL